MLIDYGLSENVQPMQLFHWINGQLVQNPLVSQSLEETTTPESLPDNTVIYTEE